MSPFSNLDPTLRDQVRRDTAEILRAGCVTAVFVTHSREEALLIGDVIALMNRGRIEQVDTPTRIFHSPANRFVAGFMGMADFLPASVKDGELLTELGSARLPQRTPDEEGLEAMVRPDDVLLRPSPRLAAGSSWSAGFRARSTSTGWRWTPEPWCTACVTTRSVWRWARAWRLGWTPRIRRCHSATAAPCPLTGRASKGLTEAASARLSAIRP